MTKIAHWGNNCKGGERLSPKKLGRPTDNPKRHDIRVRVDDATLQVLLNYCKATGKNRAEGIRDGINRLKPSEKK